MVNILQWLTGRMRAGLPRVPVERRGGQERRQCRDRRSEPREGEQQPSRRYRQRRYACAGFSN